MIEIKLKLSKSELRVFSYMAEFGSITTLQAFNDLGNARLSATIFSLKEKGVVIKTEQCLVYNRFGEKRRVAKYSLV